MERAHGSARTGSGNPNAHLAIDHDLSAVGNGTPAVVQIHDPNCGLCRRLRRNVAAIEDEFDERIQFRIADIRTAKGASLARHHKVPHVTLLLFDGDGRLANVLHGVQSANELRPAFQRLLRL